jgi:hypothetical protein
MPADAAGINEQPPKESQHCEQSAKKEPDAPFQGLPGTVWPVFFGRRVILENVCHRLNVPVEAALQQQEISSLDDGLDIDVGIMCR